uniref:DNA damage-inducible protein 1 n=1 Tax=Spongospora subterranea TaxID=70186 RepID=A0A0H5QHA8_9EUKA|eukprot:CRZ01353.1 hypothetical protein [Spongospora subterranea]
MAHERISITVVLQGDSGLIVCFPVDSNQLVDEIKAMLEAHWGIPMASLLLSFHGRILGDTERLDAAGVSSNDLLQAEVKNPSQSHAPAPLSVDQQAILLRNQIRSNAAMMQQLRTTNPAIADAVVNDDPAVFQRLMHEQQRVLAENRLRDSQRSAAMNADPFNEEHQRAIEEEIRRNNVQSNMEAAIEHNPEAFARVCMLYVNLRVNGKSVAAFVDSGAQASVMSLKCAKSLGIAHLIDTRFAGIVKGVGSANTCGRVHYVEIQIGSQYVAASLTIVDGVDIEFLWGLDMLKKHQMCIDLEKNCLRLGHEEVKFLNEQDIPNWTKPDSETTEEAKSQGPLSPRPIIPTPVGSTAPPRTNVAPPSAANSADIATLTGLGFSQDQAARALAACGGNVEMAAGLLFSQ